MAGKPSIAEINAKIAAEKEAAEKEAPMVKDLPKELPKEKPVEMVKVVMAGYHTAIYHPYQRRWVPEIMDCPDGVEMPMDSWLKCQIEAGLVKVM